MTIWVYIFSYSFVLAIGVVLGMLIDNDNTYKVTIRKIKQRGRGNTLDSELEVNLPVISSREYRKQARVIKRNERNKRKADKRLNK